MRGRQVASAAYWLCAGAELGYRAPPGPFADDRPPYTVFLGPPRLREDAPAPAGLPYYLGHGSFSEVRPPRGSGGLGGGRF